jgi:hypothetical protein
MDSNFRVATTDCDAPVPDLCGNVCGLAGQRDASPASTPQQLRHCCRRHHCLPALRLLPAQATVSWSLFTRTFVYIYID